MGAQPNGPLPIVDLIRIGAASARDDEASCAASAWARVRPRTAAVARFPQERWDDFALGPVTAALDRVEFEEQSREQAMEGAIGDGASLHPGVRRFARHAFEMYLSTLSSESAALHPVRELWVTQRVLASVVWELYAWGRRYESTDGDFREFRFMRMGPARDRNQAEIAVAAFVAAFGARAAWPSPWTAPFQPFGAVGAQRVRVLDVGLVDGSVWPLFEGSADEVEEYFAEYGRQRVVEVSRGHDLAPGSGCAGCKRLAVCQGPMRMPGLLGVPVEEGGALRTVSISSLRYYRTCPAQQYLRGLHLPQSNEYGPEAVLGQAVHAWLEAAHADWGGCDASMPPERGHDWSAGGWQVSGELATIGVDMLTRHVEVCPFRDAPAIDTARVEPQLTFFDPTARAVVVAKPDLLYREQGRWVWRELKTTQKHRRGGMDPLEEFPQLALGVVVLATESLGAGEVGRVELEVLRPGGAEVVLLDPTAPECLATARRVLHERVKPWRADRVFEARPGRECRRCPVSQWCPDAAGPDQETRGDDTRGDSGSAAAG